MTTYTLRPISSLQIVSWDNAKIWAGGIVPNGPDADVILQTMKDPLYDFNDTSYVTIPTGNAYTVHSIELGENVLKVQGSLTAGDRISINVGGNFLVDGGTLNAASIITAGIRTSDNQSVYRGGSLSVQNATVNVGSFENNGGIDLENGTLFAETIVNRAGLSGTNATITTKSLVNMDSIQANLGTLTIKTAPGGFANLTNGVLARGRYGGAYNLDLDVGGLVTTDAASIALAYGGTIQSYDSASGRYEPLQSTLRTITSSGSLTLASAAYAFGPLTVAGAVTLDTGATLSGSDLRVAPGGRISAKASSGAGTGGEAIGSPLINDGTVEVAAETSLRLDGSISGNGTLRIGEGFVSHYKDQRYEDFATLEIAGAVASQQTVAFNNNVGHLLLDQPSTFAGTIATTGSRDEIILKGVSRDAITGASYEGNASGGTLTLQAATGPLSLHFAGNLSAASFALSAGMQTGGNDPPSVVVSVSGPAGQPPTATATVSAEIKLIYETVLGRAADPEGLAHYVEQATREGITFADEAANMAGSAEATARYGTQNDAAFVQQLFANADGAAGTGDAGLTAALVGELGRGSLTRGEVAVGVALGQQHRQAVGVNLQDGLVIPGLTGRVTADPTSPGGIAELVGLTVLGHPLGRFELETDAQMIATGTTPAQLAYQLMGYASIQARGGEFITSLYANSFGRLPDAGGLAHYQDLLDSGDPSNTYKTMSAVAAEIALSPEHVADVAEALNQGLYVPDPATSGLARLYETILGRAPDLFGLTAERHRLDQGQTLTDRATSMLASPEYAARYGTPSDQTFITELYANALGRAPEGPGLSTPGGLNTYLAELAGGTTRAGVAFEIASSAEATLHLAPQIENGFVAT